MFGRRRRGPQEPPGKDTEQSSAEAPEQERFTFGPYDVLDAPEDERVRLDLGSLRLPVPEGAKLQVEVDKSGPVRAVHLMTGLGQITVTAFAAPRSGGLWNEVVRELVSRLRADGARVSRTPGEWGEEIEAVTANGVLRFLAVDGPRWMLRGAAAGPDEHAAARVVLLRDVVRETVVVRGPEPLPVRSPLPLRLPESLADQLKQATSGPERPGTGDGSGTGGGN